MNTVKIKLTTIQHKLKVEKTQFNSFGNFHYRSCEDILNAVKPLLGDTLLILSDEVVNIGQRYYVKATASLSDGESEVTVTAYAREAESKPKMDESQLTGSASSYARKYALNGLFAIDDEKDADTRDNSETVEKPSQVTTVTHEDHLKPLPIIEMEGDCGKCGQSGKFHEKVSGPASSKPNTKYLICASCGSFYRWNKEETK